MTLPSAHLLKSKHHVSMDSRLWRQCNSRWLQGILGLLGTLALMVSCLTSHWYNGKGLWEIEGSDETPATNQTAALHSGQLPDAQRFFAGLSFLMAIAGFFICLVLLLCLGPPRPRHHQMPRPQSLLQAALMPTGFFFCVAWTFFTWRHREEIRSDWTGLGYSYWLGAAAWTVLLLILPILYLMDEWTVTGGQKPLQEV